MQSKKDAREEINDENIIALILLVVGCFRENSEIPSVFVTAASPSVSLVL